MACLDREDRTRRAEDLLRLDVADLAEIRGHSGVFEDLGGRLELRLVGRGALEVELRALHSLRAKRSLEERDVGGLVPGNDGRELAHLSTEAALGDGLVVERRLEVLERKREVEDRDVARCDSRTGDRREGAEEGASAEDCTGAKAGLAEEPGARVDAGLLSRLPNRAVRVQLFEGEEFGHSL